MANEVILRFSSVSFNYGHNKVALDEASFSVREGSKLTLMGQNGAGKSTLFSLITKEQQPKEGEIFFTPKDLSVAIAHQVMKKEYLDMSLREYFATAFTKKNDGNVVPNVVRDLDKRIKDVFEVVNLTAPNLDKKVGEFSGGQQARLLLSYALIQNPDILLLDEPTNNLDQTGIEHLTGFLMLYEKTVLVISHDAEFLNAFSDGVLYLDIFTHKIEQYTGNYFDVVEEIKQRIERENLQNARMETQIKEKRSQAEVFAHKGGKLRAVAKRMRESAEEAEENIVSVRQEDKTIREFEIPCQDYGSFFNGQVLEITSINAIKEHEIIPKKLETILRKNTHLLISGPNGIGKSTFLQSLNEDRAGGVTIAKDIVIGYYKQDFSNLDFNQRAFDCLKEAMQKFDEQKMRSTAAGFLLDGKLLDHSIESLSEGQKGLLAFCRLALLKPGLLILDEPTNHINFRHLPIIAKALHEYQGAMIVVSHIPDFVKQIRIDKEIDLGLL